MSKEAPSAEHQAAKVRDLIKQLPVEDRAAVNTIADGIRNCLKVGGGHAELAFALVGAELSARANEALS